MTINQRLRSKRSCDSKKIPVLFLNPKNGGDKIACPQKRGVVLKVAIVKPKKPNSAQRATAKVRLSNGKILNVYIPGVGHQIQPNHVVFVRKQRRQDLPGFRYMVVRGVRKTDATGVVGRLNGRSIYGTKKPKKESNK